MQQKAPGDFYLRNDTLFYTLNEKTPSFFRYSPIFALSLQL